MHHLQQDLPVKYHQIWIIIVKIQNRQAGHLAGLLVLDIVATEEKMYGWCIQFRR
jgi:hypothetical protein